MSLDIKVLGSLLKSSLDLVGKIRSAAISVEQAASALDTARQQALQTIGIPETGALTIKLGDAERAIMAKVVELQASIEATASDVAVQGALRVDLGNQFLSLTNLPNAMVASIVQFTPAERAQIAALIQQANLDTAQRKVMASVLNAAVGLAQAALTVATKL